MKKKSVLLACLAVFSCACNSEAPKEMPKSQDDQNYHERRKEMEQKPQGGCCETEKRQTPQQTAAAPEVKVEKIQPPAPAEVKPEKAP